MARPRLAAAYEILRRSAETGQTVTAETLVSGTGWAPSTVRTYLGKQWEAFVAATGDGSYVVDPSFLDYPLDVFERINSQKFLVNKDPFKPVLSPTTESLIVKSREAALLAVQVYNNPTLTFRTPSFIVHMIIAYTSLFHGIFEEEGREYVYRDSAGNVKLTATNQPWLWDLGQCIRAYWADTNSAVRDNLRLFIELRNEIEHRYAPAFDVTISEHCQAMLLNYERLITHHFSPYYALGANISVPLQLSHQTSAARVDALKELQRGDYRILTELLERFSQVLPAEERDSPEFRFRVLLVQVPANHPQSADLSLRFVKYEELTDEVRAGLRDAITLVKTKTVEAANAGNLRPGAVVKIIQDAVDPRFRQHEHQLAWKFFGVRPREPKADGCDTRFCHFDVAHGDFVYTQAWVEKLKTAVADKDTYTKIRAYKDPVQG